MPLLLKTVIMFFMFQAWDDVERKIKPNLEPQKYRNELVLDQQKPKQSLAEVYEQEFLKQSQVFDQRCFICPF